MISPATAIAQIHELLAVEKSFVEWPSWTEHGSARGGRWQFVSTFEKGGVFIAGLRVRGSALRDVSNREVTVQVEAMVGSRWLHVFRADYQPLGDHKNPPDRRDLPRRILPGCSHVHSFADNVRNGKLDGLDPRSNLPSARIMDPEPSSVRAFFGMVGAMLSVPDFASIDPPAWQGGLPL